MPADSTIRLQVVTTADTAGLDKATVDTQKLGQAVAVTTATTNTATKGQETLETAVKRTQTTTANTGQTMLNFGRILQDGVAAGLPGMVNNFEGLAMSLGLGTGVAGAVTVLAVGLQTLIPILTATDTKAREAAEAQKELEESTRKAAIEASQQARSAERAAASQDRLEAALMRANKAYEAQVEASTAARKAKEEEIRLRQIEGDAAAELAMAETEDALARGAISPDQAEQQKNKIARESERRRFEAEQDRKKAAEIDMVNKANAERQKAEEISRTRRGLESATTGGLSDEQRKEAEERVKKAELEERALAKQLAEKREREQVAAKELKRQIVPDPFEIEDAERTAREARDTERRLKEAQDRVKRERRPLDDAERMFQSTGFKSKEEAEKAIQDLHVQEELRRAEAERLSREAAISEQSRGRESGAFQTRERAADIREGTAGIRRSSELEAERQGRAQQNRRDQESVEAARAKEAAKNATKSAGGAASTIEELTSQLIELQRTNAAAIAKLRAQIEEVQAITQTHKEGH